MRRLSYVVIILLILIGGVLVAFAPDSLSMAVAGIMWVIVCAGSLLGLFPLIAYSNAFDVANANIARASGMQTSSAWLGVLQIESFFQQRMLDDVFFDYKEKVQKQRESGQIMADIEDYINEEVLSLRSWNGVILQIPSTLTGLGILGTFIGLIFGIGGVGFSSIDAALSSVQNLLNGIEVAFYTSIVGVVLSILFNIIYRLVWNMTIRQLGVFILEFHKNIIPSSEEQTRYRERKEMQQILERLDRIPKNTGYSLSAGPASAGTGQIGSQNESLLMPQILTGMRNGEFGFYLQPRFDLNTRKVVGAEALVRWNHGKLGMVSPAVFLPVLEKNGYITKLDQYIWEQVCKTIRRWVDAGLRPAPLSVNVSKTDVLAIDIADFFNGMMKKYRIPPRYLDIEIAKNAYLEAHDEAFDAEESLLQHGFRVFVDGFDGDFFALQGGKSTNADIWKLDLRQIGDVKNTAPIAPIFDQGRKLRLTILAEGIESMEQLTALRKSGCSEGQGFHFCKPVSVTEFEQMMTQE